MHPKLPYLKIENRQPVRSKRFEFRRKKLAMYRPKETLFCSSQQKNRNKIKNPCIGKASANNNTQRKWPDIRTRHTHTHKHTHTQLIDKHASTTTYVREQSMSCCSLTATRSFPAMAHMPSIAPVTAKAQHEPHWPWSLTAVTTPASRQSLVATLTPLDTCWRAMRTPRSADVL